MDCGNETGKQASYEGYPINNDPNSATKQPNTPIHLNKNQDGSLSPDQNGDNNSNPRDELVLLEYKHKIPRQNSVLLFMLVLVFILFFMSFCVIYVIFKIYMTLILSNKFTGFDWHIWFIPITLITPATILGVSMIRAIFMKKDHNDSNSNGIESLFRDFIKAAMSFFKAP